MAVDRDDEWKVLATWMNLENIMVIEISQIEKKQMLYGTIYMQNLKKETNDFIETDNTMVAARAWGERPNITHFKLQS